MMFFYGEKMFLVSILSVLLIAPVFGDEKLRQKCGRLGTTSTIDKSKLHDELFSEFPIDNAELRAEGLEVNVDPAKHTVIAERCERKKNSDQAMYHKTIYKVSKLIDLDKVVAVATDKGTLEIKAPYGADFEKPARVIDVEHSNEPYTATSTFTYLDASKDVVPYPTIDMFHSRVFEDAERELAKMEPMLFLRSLESYDMVADSTNKGYRAEVNLQLAEGVLRKSLIGKIEMLGRVLPTPDNVNLDEITATVHPDGIISVHLPVIKINQKPARRIDIENYTDPAAPKS